AALVEDLVRNGNLADVMELRGTRRRVEGLGVQPCLPPERAGQLPDSLKALAHRRLALAQGLHQHVARLPHGGAGATTLLSVEALVSEVQRLRRRVGFIGKRHAAERGADRKALALLRERLQGPADDRLLAVACGGGQHAELVAAEPVSGSVELRRGHREALAQAGKQSIAGRVAEAVVVSLEAVEVEEREDVGRSALRTRHV